MPSNPSHPLQLGQVVYPVQDTTLIHMPKGSGVARCQRVSFSGNTGKPQFVVHDAIDLEALADIRSARAVTHFDSGKQDVVILGKPACQRSNSTVRRKKLTKSQARVDNAVLVIGIDPTRPEEHWLALLVEDGTVEAGDHRLSVVLVNPESGERSTPQVLPRTVGSVPVAAELVRRNTSAMIVLATIGGGKLQVHALAWEDLAPSVAAEKVQTIDLGKVLTDKDARVGVAVTRMRKASSDQQLALAWADTKGSCKIALVGWGADGKASVLDRATPDLAKAPPEIEIYRLASADLLQRGDEQLVLGYIASYGKGDKLVSGCAALMLITMDESASPPSPSSARTSTPWPPPRTRHWPPTICTSARACSVLASGSR